jgi:hypothetical protein
MSLISIVIRATYNSDIMSELLNNELVIQLRSCGAGPRTHSQMAGQQLNGAQNCGVQFSSFTFSLALCSIYCRHQRF